MDAEFGCSGLPPPSTHDLFENLSDLEEESGDVASALSFKERRREAHTQAEQKRRDSIKKGYDTLQELVPTCHTPGSSGNKLSKASVLQKSIEYIEYQLGQKRRQEEARNSLRREMIGLQIMLSNYEHIVKSQQSIPDQTEPPLSDQDKFKVFQGIMDKLFQSFDSVPVNNFAEFSAGVFNWLEQHCKPQNLRGTVDGVLRDQNYTE